MTDVGKSVDLSSSESGSEDTECEIKSNYGCNHYKRRCLFVSPCCGKIYPCRLCHDEEITSHSLDRHAVREIVCSECKERQLISKKCTKCGICRVGGRDNFFHCEKCGLCLPKDKTTHKCIEKASHTNCPVCMEDIHTSRDTAHIPTCGHLIHSLCYKRLLRMGDYRCPICGVSTVAMNSTWEMMDEEIASTPMPPEYADHKVWILCKDCHSVSEVRFHVLGLKCMKCNSYNTCGTSAPESTGS
uniref:RING finger and CHY zinc finger domain-containing protein 1 n=1 Tax=Ciona savignyi TaxID=51511 RepID=H2Z9L1_CIOSA